MRVLDLFSGAVGGWSLGLHRAGFTTIAACEIDPWRRAVFSQNFPDAVMFDDMRNLTAVELMARCGCLPDIVVGSPPCQDISTANTRGKGVDGERSGLFFEAVRLVDECRPAWVALENSPNLRTRGADRVLGELEALGYTCWPLVVGADDIGANHRRKRVWIIAADAERGGVRIEPGRCCGANGAGAAVAGDDAGHACVEPVMSQRHGKSRADASGAAILADAEQGGRKGRLAHNSFEGVGTEAGLPSALVEIGRSWPHWNGGLAGLAASCAAAGFGHVDDGRSSILAPGVRNRAIAACGDAVIETIPFLIGRAILHASGRPSA